MQHTPGSYEPSVLNMSKQIKGKYNSNQKQIYITNYLEL